MSNTFFIIFGMFSFGLAVYIFVFCISFILVDLFVNIMGKYETKLNEIFDYDDKALAFILIVSIIFTIGFGTYINIAALLV